MRLGCTSRLYISAASRLQHGYASRLHLGCISAVSRLHLSCVSAASRFYILGYTPRLFITCTWPVSLGCTSTAFRLYLGSISSVSRLKASAVSWQHLGCSSGTSAPSWLHLGCIEGVSRLQLRCVSATSPLYFDLLPEMAKVSYYASVRSWTASWRDAPLHSRRHLGDISPPDTSSLIMAEVSYDVLAQLGRERLLR